MRYDGEHSGTDGNLSRPGVDDGGRTSIAVFLFAHRLRRGRAAGGVFVDLFLHPLPPAAGRLGAAAQTPSSRSAGMVLDDRADVHLHRDVRVGAVVYVDAYRAPDDATRVYGVGKQWMWKFQHPEGQREINSCTCRRPAGATAADVGRRDPQLLRPAFPHAHGVLPDRYTSVWFQATRPGTYHLFCSQYCGTNHASMIGTVVVMEPADFENWLSMHAEGSLALEGRKVFLKYRCVSCHSADRERPGPGAGRALRPAGAPDDGPNGHRRRELHPRVDPEPGAKIVAGYENIMPTFHGQISEEEIFALIAYFRSLQRGETPRASKTFRRRRRPADQPDRRPSCQDGKRHEHRHSAAARTAARPAAPSGRTISTSHGIVSWLLTKDHKRIALLYLITVTVMFFIGGFAISVVRLNLLTPEGAWSRPTRTTGCSRCTA